MPDAPRPDRLVEGGAAGRGVRSTHRTDSRGHGRGGPGCAASLHPQHPYRCRGAADPADVALTAKAGWIAHRALATVPAGIGTIGAAIAAAEGQARLLGAEEAYIAAAPDLSRDRRLVRIETSAAAPGPCFALRATVAYKGNWARLTRTFLRDPKAAQAGAVAAEQFAAAVATLPDGRAFKALPSWLVEGCRG